MNALGKLRQKWYATAEAKFTKPSQSLLAEHCKENSTLIRILSATDDVHEALPIFLVLLFVFVIAALFLLGEL